MKFGFILPGGTSIQQFEQALLAEEAGWDGVFVWEAGYGVEPWTLLGAIASRTSRIRLGTMLTPLPWRRPWKVASQVATLDQISDGRATLAIGVGAMTTDLPDTGEVTDLRERAAMMDEGIDLIHHLWQGGREYHGEYYRYDCDRDDLGNVGKPVQSPIPIWVVAVWPRPTSLRRALRCGGMIPQYSLEEREPTPGDARAVREWLTQHSMGPEFDLIAEGETSGNPADDWEITQPWHEAGCTWWMETRWEMPHESEERMAEVRKRIAAGPPKAD